MTAVGKGDIAYAKLMIHAHDAGAVTNLVQALNANEAGYRIGLGEIVPYIFRGVDEPYMLWELLCKTVDEVYLLDGIVDNLWVSIV